jgi:hypothetical protein
MGRYTVFVDFKGDKDSENSFEQKIRALAWTNRTKSVIGNVVILTSAPTSSSGSQVQSSDFVIVFDAPNRDTAVTFVNDNLKVKPPGHIAISEEIT